MSRRAGRAVLLGVVALHLVADNSLSPFYPQLFADLFHRTDLAATGWYVWMCRLTAVLALPLWGLAARRWPAHRLVLVGLLVAAVLDLALAASPSYQVFTALSIGLVASTMSMALAYPALVALGDGADRLPQVRAFAVVVHLSTIAATLVGAGIMALPQQRWGLAGFAVLDLILAWFCWRILGRSGTAGAVALSVPSRRRAGIATTRSTRGSAAPRQVVPTRSTGAGAALRAVALVAVVVLAAEFGRSVVRPFFTAYAEAAGTGAVLAAGLFLLPSVAALAVLPFAEVARRRLGPVLLPVAFLLAAVGLVSQAIPGHPVWLGVGRVLLGVGLGLGQIALDLRVFAATRSRGPAFAAVETARNVALLASPVAATAAATVALPAPLFVGAGVFVLLATVLAVADRRRRPLAAEPAPTKEPNAVQPVR